MEEKEGEDRFACMTLAADVTTEGGEGTVYRDVLLLFTVQKVKCVCVCVCKGSYIFLGVAR